MFTTKKEPELFKELKRLENAKYLDGKDEVIPFLKEQFDYERQRYPMHTAFKRCYKRSYFDPTEMLNYYMNPNQTPNIQYMIEEHSAESPMPLIYKRTFN